MSITNLAIGLGVLIILSFLAKERNYLMTSVSLLVVSGVLATGLAAAFWVLG